MLSDSTYFQVVRERMCSSTCKFAAEQAASQYLSSPVACSTSSAVITPEEKDLAPVGRALYKGIAITGCTCEGH